MPKLTDWQAELLRGRNWGNLATLRADGSPHVTPVWVDYDGEFPLVNSAYGRAKVRHIQRDPRVSLAVLPTDNLQRGYVALSGTAELVDDGAVEQIHRLAKKYLGREEYALRPGERRVTIRIHPQRISGYLR
jgi:PPOX class probable F420-dependent enzyme